MAKHSGQDKKDEFELSLKGKDVPALTLDNKWYHLLGKVGFEELEKYALEKGEVTDSLSSGRQEMLESIINNIMFSL